MSVLFPSCAALSSGFGGASFGTDPKFGEAARCARLPAGDRRLRADLRRSERRTHGLDGRCSPGTRRYGDRRHAGVSIAKEVAHKGLTQLNITTSMHKRKKVVAELSDAFIALPGGLGTREEFFEVLTWVQLAQHF